MFVYEGHLVKVKVTGAIKTCLCIAFAVVPRLRLKGNIELIFLQCAFIRFRKMSAYL